MAAAAGPSPFEPGTGVMPAFDGVAITPTDANFTGSACRALFIGVAGNVKLVTMGGVSLNFQNLQAGSILPVMCIQVSSTSTTASGIIGLF